MPSILDCTNAGEVGGGLLHVGSAEIRAFPGDLSPPGRQQVERPRDRRGDGWYRDALLRDQPAQGPHREPRLREDEGYRQGHGLSPTDVVRGGPGQRRWVGGTAGGERHPW